MPSFTKYARVTSRLLLAIGAQPGSSLRILNTLPSMLRGARLARTWRAGRAESSQSAAAGAHPNSLQRYAQSHTCGPGIWKWDHYFDIYDRHFSKFIGQDVNIVEVGIFSGGSLGMWRDYFGPRAHIYGIDIEPACRVYESDGTRIFIGDQSDRGFWRVFREQVPRVDVLIDDGGHLPEQQIVTLEEMLPHIGHGGVYVCEDMHGVNHKFAAYVYGLTTALNAYRRKPGAEPVVEASALQRTIQSLHVYPFVTVIEKTPAPVDELASRRHGTEWQPFLQP